MDYSPRATPPLVALCTAAFVDQAVRDWLVARTDKAEAFAGSRSLHVLQAGQRKPMKQPFFVNYWWGAGRLAACTPAGSVACEVDAMLFLEATSGRRLAIHIEFKSPREALGLGQAAAYPLRAAHFANRAFCPPNMVPHDDWLTLLLRADDELGKPAFAAFCRVIGHGEAARMVPGYIDPQRQRNV